MEVTRPQELPPFKHRPGMARTGAVNLAFLMGEHSLLSLSGKTALVTGGNGGLGRAIAELFVQLGARVGSIDTTGTHDLAGVSFYQADITKEASIVRAMDGLTAEIGSPFNVLVNAAAITGTGKPTHLATGDEFDRVFSVNVKGTFLCNKHFIARCLHEETDGTIVNISSINGVIGNEDIPLYHATKAAVQLMSRCDAIAYADRGIRSNSLLPGSIRTEMTQRAMRESADPDGYVRKLVSAHPIGRQAEPQEIAWVTAFLASSASSFITGAEIVADGGFTTK